MGRYLHVCVFTAPFHTSVNLADIPLSARLVWYIGVSICFRPTNICNTARNIRHPTFVFLPIPSTIFRKETRHPVFASGLIKSCAHVHVLLCHRAGASGLYSVRGADGRAPQPLAGAGGPAA